ncbi:PREDICTED: piggyBac transposable element-derived protein 4-like [Priapulus caudatus]|uniref:PiggyBac transposable element-derived protein 4-like n=1 Tax=Priapulus caudatus TaxID=37621 RepID=A0ABM1EYU5_PRICU|nr:PREDICTED: piggyBac transposable element-derived protein 4-like [Priapulus caudatus]
MRDPANAMSFFSLFITLELLQSLVYQTNLYAAQQLKDVVLKPFSRLRFWKPTTVPEMKKFLGLLILMGIVRKPQMEMFWSTDEMLETPFVRKVMSRDRFFLLWKFFHFSDNENKPENCTDKLYKVRPVYDYLIQKFRDLFQPNRQISIDEGMLAWRGRLSFRVYNPAKPIKYGIKGYILADSATGYCWNIDLYCGNYTPLSVTIYNLLDRLLNHGYCLYMDNFYNSVSLAESLAAAGTWVCGTLRKNRGGPAIINKIGKVIKLRKGEVISRDNGTVMVMTWMDKRPVTMISTMHDDSFGEAAKRDRRTGTEFAARQAGYVNNVVSPSAKESATSNTTARRTIVEECIVCTCSSLYIYVTVA